MRDLLAVPESEKTQEVISIARAPAGVFDEREHRRTLLIARPGKLDSLENLLLYYAFAGRPKPASSQQIKTSDSTENCGSRRRCNRN